MNGLFGKAKDRKGRCLGKRPSNAAAKVVFGAEVG
jgi:hypothetical protein